jgi:tetratricopeptide (TPR) repeat protein
MQIRFLFLLCLLLLGAACKKNDTPVTPQPTFGKEVQVTKTAEPAVPLPAAPLFSQPLATTIIEATNEALPIWRSFAKNRPALIIAANTPAMLAVPAELRTEVDALLNNADDKELTKRSSPNNPDPLLLPIMSLSAALDAGWFSQVLWIFPSKNLPEQLELATFQQQLIAAGIATPDEATSFTLSQGNFSGIIRGRPFTAAPAATLPPLEQSALLHIDADYFKPLYSGEIKTPIYPLMVDFLNKLKAQNWKIAAATVVLSNQQFDALPLQTRFLGKDLAAVLQNPQMLKDSFPRQWERRANALYLENFMQKEEIHKLYLEMEKIDPRDPDVKFGLYNISRQRNQPDHALVYLKSAVQIDPAYALEYLALAQLASEKNLPEKAVVMLQFARAALPENPFILTQTVHTLLTNNQQEEAKALKPKLATLKWSKIYYPEQVGAQEAILKLLEGK